MAAPKRKRNTTRTEPTKRRKHVKQSPEPLWSAERILDERTQGRKLQYLIEWRDIDPATGEPYAPTWESDDSPTPDLLLEWQTKKAAHARAGASNGAEASKPLRDRPAAHRPSRVVESSAEPEPSAADSTTAGATPQTTTAARDGTVPTVPPSSTVASPITSPQSLSKRPSLAIHVEPRSSFDPAEYELFSQLSPTPQSSPQSDTQASDLDSSQLFAAAPVYQSSGIVPDSQSFTGEASFDPGTGTTQCSSTAEDSLEGVTEDSGLLDIVQPAASRASSPARSIPETVYDPTVESQTQRWRSVSEERPEEGQGNTPEAAHELLTLTGEDNSGASISQVFDSQDRRAHEESTANLERVDGSAAPLLNEERQSLSAGQVGATESGESQVEEDNNIRRERGEGSPPQAGNNTLLSQRQDSSGASLAERSEPDDIAHHSVCCQPPFHDSSRLLQVQESASENLRETQLGLITSNPLDAGSISGQVHSTPIDTSTSEAARALPDNPPPVLQAIHGVLDSPGQTGDRSPHNENLELDPARISTPEAAQQTQAAAQPATTIQSTTETTQRQDIDFKTSFSLEQNAQVVHTDHDISTQDDTTETIWATVEQAYTVAPSSPSSRHDSSQDTPEPPAKSVTQGSSSIAPPPSESLGTLVSNVPSRPCTPIPTSSLSIMATPPDIGAASRKISREREPEHDKKKAESHAALLENIRANTASMSPAAAGASVDASITHPTLPRTGVPPSAPLTEGTRSPSTVPDRYPAPQAPTSLRTIAISQASKMPFRETDEEESHTSSVNGPNESAAKAAPVVPDIITTEATMADVTSSDDDDANEASDQSQATEQSQSSNRSDASLLEDELDLNLAVNEKMVPLSMLVRQRDHYRAILTKEKDMLGSFLSDPHSFGSLVNIQGLLAKLRDLENHFDLIYEEASLPSNDGADIDPRDNNALSWGIDNSVKFRFLWGMFEAMRSQNKHLLLVTQNDSDALYQKIEQLCRASAINFKMPTKVRQAVPTQFEGDLLVTVFPSASSPIIKPADLIICLDGAQDALQMRQKNWAVNPSTDFVPVLHLVIPRSVGHIERCLSSSLSDRERMHTILACLAHMRHQLGDPINGEVVEATVAATQVAAWLDNQDDGEEEWPLEPLGSVTEAVEFLTQRSPGPATPPATERSKRPHEDEVLDPAKRMRLTPQPIDRVSSSVNEHEITRISDSMPGTAADSESTLRSQLAYVESILKKEQAEMQSERARFQETKIMWDRQQTEHEDLARSHRLLQSSQEKLNDQVDTLKKSNEVSRERLAARTEEARTVADQLKRERETHLLSSDEKTAEIAKLRNELAQAIQDKERAVKNAASAESTLEYTKEQYRTAQDAATTAAATVTNLEAQNAKLAHAASGERQKLKAMHLDRQHKSQVTANKTLRAENENLKKALAQKEIKLAKANLNGGRMGVGTRATSVTPQPNRVRSRAGSPSVAGGRLSNLRNG